MFNGNLTGDITNIKVTDDFENYQMKLQSIGQDNGEYTLSVTISDPEARLLIKSIESWCIFNLKTKF